jgi:hypothetical protein
MTEQERLLSINYLNLLSALEQACRTGEDPILAGDRGRLRDYGKSMVHFLLRAFSLRASDMERLRKAVEMAADGTRDKERRLLRSILNSTQPRKGYSGVESAHKSQKRYPPEEITGRLVATILGLHAENRHDPRVSDNVQACLDRAVEHVLVPALAWNLATDLLAHNQRHHAELLQNTRAALHTGWLGANAGKVDLAQGHVTLPSLLMIKAWTKLLADEFGYTQEAIARLLVQPIAQTLEGTDIPTVRNRLELLVDKAYGWGEHGSERSLAIRLANQAGASAARIDKRLDLLKAAASAEAQEWNALLEKKPAEALAKVNRQVDDRSLGTLQAAGKAFWLSRYCFRRTAEGKFLPATNGVSVNTAYDTSTCKTLDEASESFLGLMDLAYELPTTTPEQRLLLARFQAGFATNPRYWRSHKVLKAARGLVDRYKGLEGHLDGLVSHFEARLALHDWYVQNGHQAARLVPDKPLRLYRAIFESSPSFTHNLDAEAPVHLFPEIIILLTLGSDNAAMVAKALEDVDLILKCNFGVYMDIESEKAAILGGLSQARSWSNPSPVSAGR